MIFLGRHLPICLRSGLLKVVILYVFYRVFTACLDYKFETAMTSNGSSALYSTGGNLWRHNFTALFTPSLFGCRNNFSKSPLIVVVTSKPDHFSLRSAIRQTWATIFNRSSVGVVFVLGHDETNKELTNALSIESSSHGDLLVIGFNDTYHNLSLKSFLALKWVHSLVNGTRCARDGDIDVKFVLKADDDVFVYATNILRFISDIKNAAMKAYCYRFDHALVSRDSSNPKRYTPYSLYPRRYYPPFCSGHAYILTTDGIGPLLDYIQRLYGYVYLEDVLFTGLAAEAVGIKRVHDRRFQWWNYDGHFFTDVKNAFSLHYVTSGPSMEKLFHNHQKRHFNF